MRIVAPITKQTERKKKKFIDWVRSYCNVKWWIAVGVFCLVMELARVGYVTELKILSLKICSFLKVVP